MSFLILIPSTVYAESEINCEDRGKKFDGYMIESKAKGYELIHKIYHPTNSEEIILTLCWIVDDEIQVGKLITIDAKVSKAYPIMNNSKHMITITFPNDLINYWIIPDKNYARQYAYNTSDKLILKQINSTFFKSEPINFRFTVPEKISVEFCEYFPEKYCFPVKNLLQPASYYLDQVFELNLETHKLSVESNELNCTVANYTFYLLLLGFSQLFFIISTFVYGPLKNFLRKQSSYSRIVNPLLISAFALNIVMLSLQLFAYISPSC